jgi:hypothetical protein
MLLRAHVRYANRNTIGATTLLVYRRGEYNIAKRESKTPADHLPPHHVIALVIQLRGPATLQRAVLPRVATKILQPSGATQHCDLAAQLVGSRK